MLTKNERNLLMWLSLALLLGGLIIAVTKAQGQEAPRIEGIENGQRKATIVSSEVKPLTHEEINTLRTDQVYQLRALSALQATPEYRQWQVAQEKINADIAKIYSDRKLAQADAALCDGPGAGACEGVKEKELALLPVKKEAKK
jgi:hypothetical protein